MGGDFSGHVMSGNVLISSGQDIFLSLDSSTEEKEVSLGLS